MNAPINLSDSLRSLVTGLGGERDKGSSGRFALTQRRLSQTEIIAMWRDNWLAARAVEMPAEDMTAQWRTFQGRSSDVAAIEAEEQRLGLQAKVCAALKLKARDGAACLLIGADNGLSPDQPLEPGEVGKGGPRYIHLLSRNRISFGPIEMDPASAWAGHPREYRLFMDDGRYLPVHPSRAALFSTTNLDACETGSPFGESIYQQLHDPLRDLEQTLRAIQHLVMESKQDVIHVEGLNQNVMRPDYSRSLIARFSLAAQMKGLLSCLILDKNETWEAKQLSFSGLPELLDRLTLVASGAVGIPTSRLFERSSASGLQASTAGESDDQRYFSRLASQQRTEVSPVLRIADDCPLRSALGRRPKGIFYTWNDLWSLDAREQAEIRLKHSQAVKNLVDTNLIDPKPLAAAVVSQTEDDAWLPSLGSMLAAAPQEK